MTKTIILACVGGLTTSMLVERIQEVIYRDKLDYSFYSVGITGIDTLKNIDVLLLGPQLAYLEEKAKASLNVPVAVKPPHTPVGETSLDLTARRQHRPTQLAQTVDHQRAENKALRCHEKAQNLFLPDTIARINESHRAQQAQSLTKQAIRWFSLCRFRPAQKSVGPLQFEKTDCR